MIIMTTDADHAESSWQAIFNAPNADAKTDWPTWADTRQQKLWNTPGLVVWDHASHTIIALQYHHAHTLLVFLRITSDWRTLGLRIGNIALQYMRKGADHPPPVQQIPEPVFASLHGSANGNFRSVLSDPMDITPAQAQHLLTVLEAHELTLHVVERAFWEQIGGATAPVFQDFVQNVGNPAPTIEDATLRMRIEQMVRAKQRAREKKQSD
jgi:hypothetical protein